MRGAPQAIEESKKARMSPLGHSRRFCDVPGWSAHTPMAAGVLTRIGSVDGAEWCLARVAPDYLVPTGVNLEIGEEHVQAMRPRGRTPIIPRSSSAVAVLGECS